VVVVHEGQQRTGRMMSSWPASRDLVAVADEPFAGLGGLGLAPARNKDLGLAQVAVISTR